MYRAVPDAVLEHRDQESLRGCRLRPNTGGVGRDELCRDYPAESTGGVFRAACRSRGRLEADLATWEVDGHRVVKSVSTREELYSGACVSDSPDVILELNLRDDYSYTLLPSLRVPSGTTWRRLEPSEYVGGKGLGMNGTHRQFGLLSLWGRGVVAGGSVEAGMPDIAPTLLHLMGEPVPEHMDGRVISEAIAAHQAPERTASELTPRRPASATESEAQAIRERLERGLSATATSATAPDYSGSRLSVPIGTELLVYVRGSRALARRGHDVVVVCYAHGGESTPISSHPDPQHSRLQQSSSRARLGRPFSTCACSEMSCLRTWCMPITTRLPSRRCWRSASRERPSSTVRTTRCMKSSRPTSGDPWRGASQVVWARCLIARFHAWPSMLLCSQTKPRSPCGSSGAVRSRRWLPGSTLRNWKTWCRRAAGGAMWSTRAVRMSARSAGPHGRDASAGWRGLLMVSASCLDDWAQVGLPKFMAVQASDFSEVSASSRERMWRRSSNRLQWIPHQAAQHTGLGVPTVVAEGSARSLPGEVVVPRAGNGARHT